MFFIWERNKKNDSQSSITALDGTVIDFVDLKKSHGEYTRE